MFYHTPILMILLSKIKIETFLRTLHPNFYLLYYMYNS